MIQVEERTILPGARRDFLQLGGDVWSQFQHILLSFAILSAQRNIDSLYGLLPGSA